jgi:hypothetical protein
MTTGFLKLKKCYICGAGNRYPEIGSSVAYVGTRDLDTRFSQTQRTAMYLWIQQCISCGYCSNDISTGTPIIKEIVASDIYKAQLTKATCPQTANAFLCRSMILEATGDLLNAGWSSLYAAWICDDNGSKKNAVESRKQAFDFFEKARQTPQSFGTKGEEVVLMIDLLRRSNQLDKAQTLCALELDAYPDDRTKAILEFEAELIEKKDCKSHSVSEALEDLNL